MKQETATAMALATIGRLIINSPYEEPGRHWRYERATRLFNLAEGRRPGGYVVASGDSKPFDDPGIIVLVLEQILEIWFDSLGPKREQRGCNQEARHEIKGNC